MAHVATETELATNFTVADYIHARDSSPPDRTVIAKALHKRFTERYIRPSASLPKHGFTMLAVSCLMIEALESFRQGWESSEGRSKSAFCFFFDGSDEFKDFRGHAQQFYKHVRCGILHQAETTGGWRIRRDRNPLFDPETLVVNAELFLDALRRSLDKYCDELTDSPWDSAIWKNARRKLNALVRNCSPQP